MPSWAILTSYGRHTPTMAGLGTLPLTLPAALLQPRAEAVVLLPATPPPQQAPYWPRCRIGVTGRFLMAPYLFDLPRLCEQECAGTRRGEKRMAALIEAQGLVKSFGTLSAVDGITLNVARGEVLGFLGPNGAGKSTTMRLITGFLEPDAGSARIAGFDVQEQPKEAKKRLGYLPEGAPLYTEMTPSGLLAFIGELR